MVGQQERKLDKWELIYIHKMCSASQLQNTEAVDEAHTMHSHMQLKVFTTMCTMCRNETQTIYVNHSTNSFSFLPSLM